MIYGNMDKETGTSQATGFAKKKKEPACKRSCQPIGNTALTDMQTTKSTAEQPRSLTVHIQQLEAEHSASPGQSLTDNLHITEPFQPTNFNFPKKTFGKQNRSIPNTCGNVIQMSNDAAKKTMATNRFCLLKIIECLQYLARQAMPMQGDTDEESNFIQLLKLRGKDEPVLLKWLERKDDKYTSHEIQNEIISIMANNVIRDLVADIRGGFLQLSPTNIQM
ncbi:unnamed protein product [Porites lobata]|uniref:Uncharacterized protein n=1 Tax=Porites lobata TaxID=104759 RepID=A0ABN8PBT9_9CNID|nr:unnamed protein product [Porites lobata]